MIVCVRVCACEREKEKSSSERDGRLAELGLVNSFFLFFSDYYSFFCRTCRALSRRTLTVASKFSSTLTGLFRSGGESRTTLFASPVNLQFSPRSDSVRVNVLHFRQHSVRTDVRRRRRRHEHLRTALLVSLQLCGVPLTTIRCRSQDVPVSTSRFDDNGKCVPQGSIPLRCQSAHRTQHDEQQRTEKTHQLAHKSVPGESIKRYHYRCPVGMSVRFPRLFFFSSFHN